MAEAFATDIPKHMKKVQEHLIKVGNYLITMEHGGHSATKEDTDTAAAAKAKQECNDVAKALEEDTKRVMEATGRPFLKEKMGSSKTLGIPEIVEQVTNNLFTQQEPKAPQRRRCRHHYCTPRHSKILPGLPTLLPQAVVPNVRRQGGSTATA